MEFNKNYFTLYTSPTNAITSYSNISFKSLVGHLYDDYRAFSIKLEGFVCRTANTPVIDQDFCLLHLDGLHFFNGYDSCQSYASSRVLEMIDYSTSGNNGYNFVSNCNAVNFYRPTSHNVSLTLFTTSLTDETVIVGDEAQYLFSITALKGYKEAKIIKQPHSRHTIVRSANTKTISFTLLTRNGTKLDSRNRAWKFSNINLCSLIPEYNKYEKFILITKSVSFSEWDGIDYKGTYSGYIPQCIMLSGFAFDLPQTTQTLRNTTVPAELLLLDSIHTYRPVVICQTSINGGATRAYRETYVENTFIKSNPNINICISINTTLSYQLCPANAGNTQSFPHYAFQFDIVPVIN